MSRKKLKGFDPGNNNKARRDAYEKLMDGKAVHNQAPRPNADANRLTGAARRFATQLLISKKLDARDQMRRDAHQASMGKRKRSSSNDTQFLPDYKQQLAAQIAASQARAAKSAAKEEKKRLAKERAAGATPAAAPVSAAKRDEPADEEAQQQTEAGAASSAKGGAVSLSKSLEQQRQAKADRAAAEKQRSSDSERKAAAAQAAAAAADSAAADVDAKERGEVGNPKVAPKITFKTEMRPGESFRSYQARLVREKSEKMQIEVKNKALSEKKKRKLAEREEKKKQKKDPNVDTRDLRFQAERDAKDAADAARLGKGVDDDDELDRAPKRARTTATEFAPAESVGFGDIVDRPPTLTVVPKSKALPGAISHDRIIDSLLLMQEGKAKKRGGLKGMSDEEKAEWIAKQRDVLRRQDAQAAADQRALESLRAQSVAAYKASKLKRRAEEAEAAGNTDAEKPYIKKSVLKKMKRNRERMQQFKDNADLDLDLEIEMAGGFDD